MKDKTCDMCDGEDGPAIKTVTIRDWDNSTFKAKGCKQCLEDHASEIVK